MRTCARGLPRALAIPVLLWSGCTPEGVGSIMLDGFTDEDRDGWRVAEDCDDGDALANPGRREVCQDGRDNDCDGTDDGCGLDPRIGLGGADARLVGEDGGDHAGWTVAAAGDVDGDGFDDVLVGAYEDGEGGELAGAAFLFYGPLSGSINLARADAKLVGEEPFDYAGWSVAGAGDLDRDGHGDVLVGAYGADSSGTSAGVVYVLSGPLHGTIDLSSAPARLEGAAPYDYAGISVAGLGDTDGDGYDDVAVGAYGHDSEEVDAGAAYVFRGPLLGTRGMDSAAARLQGDGPGHWFGWSVAGAGDVDGDGRADLLVGAPGVPSPAGPDSGAAYLYPGPISGSLTAAAAGAVMRATRANDRAGASVAGGDLDGDGFSDVVMGGWGADDGPPDSGSAWVFHGPLLGDRPVDSAEAAIAGAAEGDGAGIAVAVVGDVDSDERADLLIGGVGADPAGPDSGSAWLLHGPFEGAMSLSEADVELAGESAGDRAGGAVAGAGDVDGDGFGDLLVGAHGNDAGGDDGGCAYLVYGQGW